MYPSKRIQYEEELLALRKTLTDLADKYYQSEHIPEIRKIISLIYQGDEEKTLLQIEGMLHIYIVGQCYQLPSKTNSSVLYNRAFIIAITKLCIKYIDFEKLAKKYFDEHIESL